MMAETRLILDCETLAGTCTASSYTMPRLLELLDGLSPEKRPSLIRGDCGFGNEPVLASLETRGIPYLLKVKQTKGVKALINLVNSNDSKWKDAGQGWEGVTPYLKLQGWTQTRRVVVIRRELEKRNRRRTRKAEKSGQLWLPGFEWAQKLDYEYAVLVTTLNEEMLEGILKQQEEGKLYKDALQAKQFDTTKASQVPAIIEKSLAVHVPQTFSFVFTIAQLYRDRATSENTFDELKNQ